MLQPVVRDDHVDLLAQQGACRLAAVAGDDHGNPGALRDQQGLVADDVGARHRAGEP